MRLRTPPEDALDWTLPPSPHSQAFAAVVLQSIKYEWMRMRVQEYV